MTPPACYAPAITTLRVGPSYWSGREEPVGGHSGSYTEFLKHRLFERLDDAVQTSHSVSVDANTSWYANRFIALLPINAPEPDIIIEEDGEVAFDWGTSARATFSVSVGRDGVLRFAGLFDGKTRFGSDQLTSTIPGEILSYISASMR